MTTLTAYRVPPQMEFRAAEELRMSGFDVELPTETLTRHSPGRKPVVRSCPLMRGYVPATGKPHDARYVKQAIGRVSVDDLIRVQNTADRMQHRNLNPQNPFQIGQQALNGQVPGFIAGTDGSKCKFAFMLLGKQHVKTLHYSRLRPG